MGFGPVVQMKIPDSTSVVKQISGAWVGLQSVLGEAMMNSYTSELFNDQEQQQSQSTS